MSTTPHTDELHMARALELARSAQALGDVPVGAVIIDVDGGVIAEAANGPISLNDPTAHAEVLALRQAGAVQRNYRLPGCSIYVTLEPCAMCAAALVHARVQRLVFGADDTKTGACGGAFNVLHAPAMNHRIAVDSGVLAGECAALLRDFFQSRR